MNLRRIRPLAWVATAVLALGVVAVPSVASADDDDDDEEEEQYDPDVTYCRSKGHLEWSQRTERATRVAARRIYNPSNIIPPFEFEALGQEFFYPGLNLDATFEGVSGRTILANGCILPPPPTTTSSTTTTSTTTTTTIPPTTSTTSTTTSTTAPATSTTTTAPTTTAPPAPPATTSPPTTPAPTTAPATTASPTTTSSTTTSTPDAPELVAADLDDDESEFAGPGPSLPLDGVPDVASSPSPLPSAGGSADGAAAAPPAGDVGTPDGAASTDFAEDDGNGLLGYEVSDAPDRAAPQSSTASTAPIDDGSPIAAVTLALLLGVALTALAAVASLTLAGRTRQ